MNVIDNHFTLVRGNVSERCKPYVPYLLDYVDGMLEPFFHLILDRPEIHVSVETKVYQGKDNEGVLQTITSVDGVCELSFLTKRKLTVARPFDGGIGELTALSRRFYTSPQHVGITNPPEAPGWVFWLFNRNERTTSRRYVEWDIGFWKIPIKETTQCITSP